MTLNRTHVKIINCEFGKVGLTWRQLELILATTRGLERGGNKGSSYAVLNRKLRRATGWSEMRFCALCCRFAYKYGLEEL